MANLNQTVQSLAHNFASELVAAVRGMSLDEILGLSGAGAKPPSAPRAANGKATPGKRGRPAKLTVDAIVAVLKQHKDGLRSDHLRKALAAARGPLRYGVKKAIAEKRVGMRGTKNAAVYFAR